MNFLEAVDLVFPDGVMVTDGTLSGSCSCVEVHDLQQNAVPKNCEVIASGEFQYFADQESRDAYLIKVKDLVLMVRILPGDSMHKQRYAQVRLASLAMASTAEATAA